MEYYKGRGRVVSNNTLAKSKYVALFMLFRPLSREAETHEVENTLGNRSMRLYVFIEKDRSKNNCQSVFRNIGNFFNSLFTDVSKTCTPICVAHSVATFEKFITFH